MFGSIATVCGTRDLSTYGEGMAKVADRIVEALQVAGVKRLFGMPGGGSGTDLIEAAGHAGLPFSLAHTETASAFMASTQAEITGTPGACLTTLGPGAASVMNGVAHAYLDRVPLIVLTDCYSEAVGGVMEHQRLRHGEMFQPIVKWSARPRAEDIDKTLEGAVEAVMTLPYGPVHLDVSGELTSQALVTGQMPSSSSRRSAGSDSSGPISPFISDMLHDARYPVLLIGLAARTKEISAVIQGLCEKKRVPALVTYKAKGVVPDRHRWFGGVLTNGALERDILERADLFLAVGLDPVELLPRPWKFSQPVVSVTNWAMRQNHIPLVTELVGDIVPQLEAVFELLPPRSEWACEEVHRLVEIQRERMRSKGRDGKLTPYRVTELAAEAYPDARVTVDAGAHMFPVMALWPAKEPCGMLISNGLATMGFALPAAIGATLLDRSKATLALTGDGGLLMCLAELRTAAREALPVRVVVFDDSALSLIKIKQIQRAYRTEGVTIGAIDWTAVASGLGVLTCHVAQEEALWTCLRNTASHPGPVLIAVKIAPETYQDSIRVLRG